VDSVGFRSLLTTVNSAPVFFKLIINTPANTSNRAGDLHQRQLLAQKHISQKYGRDRTDRTIIEVCIEPIRRIAAASRNAGNTVENTAIAILSPYTLYGRFKFATKKECVTGELKQNMQHTPTVITYAGEIESRLSWPMVCPAPTRYTA